MAFQLQRASAGRLALHLLGILALMWPALINGQPFFFPDTTAYVRAGDMAVQVASHHRIRTAWSRVEVPAPPPAAPVATATPASPPGPVHASDGQNGGTVMAGRSPYFGLLLYLGYVSSSFWLFVLAQAIVAWWLIGLAQRCFGCRSLPFRLGLAALVALLTPLPIYLGLLLADALAGFGILAFLILVRPPADLARWERIALAALMLVSATSHLTHILIIAGMTGLLALAALIRATPFRTARAPLLIGAGVTVAGLLSVMLTNVLVAKALGKPPAAAPVMTARMIVDGPGRAFILTGCGGRHFAACTRPTAAPDSDIWLWSADPAYGGFVAADAPTRAALSAEDGRFALAVLRAYPGWQTGMMALNTWRQLSRFDLAILNERGFGPVAATHDELPPAIAATMRGTLAGRNLWPMAAMSMIEMLVTIAALVALVAALAKLRTDRPEAFRLLLLWVALLAAAFLINAFLGGAVSNPQTRYQERIVWLIPFVAMLAGGCAWGSMGVASGDPRNALGRAR